MSVAEGPKARHTAEQASEAYIAHPPSADELDKISQAQKLITDDWTGEPTSQTVEQSESVAERARQNSETDNQHSD